MGTFDTVVEDQVTYEAKSRESSTDFDIKEEVTGIFKNAFGRKSSSKSDSPTALSAQEKQLPQHETTQEMREEPVTTDSSNPDATVITSRERSVTTEQVNIEATAEEQKMTKVTDDKDAKDQATVEANSRESSPEFDIKEDITGMLKKAFTRNSSGKSDS